MVIVVVSAAQLPFTLIKDLKELRGASSKLVLTLTAFVALLYQQLFSDHEASAENYGWSLLMQAKTTPQLLSALLTMVYALNSQNFILPLYAELDLKANEGVQRALLSSLAALGFCFASTGAIGNLVFGAQTKADFLQSIGARPTTAFLTV